jgi:hypothetical protein
MAGTGDDIGAPGRGPFPSLQHQLETFVALGEAEVAIEAVGVQPALVARQLQDAAAARPASRRELGHEPRPSPWPRRPESDPHGFHQPALQAAPDRPGMTVSCAQPRIAPSSSSTNTVLPGSASISSNARSAAASSHPRGLR